MEKRPLHVRVAEALGWTALEQRNGMDPYSWVGWHAPMEVGTREHVLDYEHDWSATGPLIEKYATSTQKYMDGTWTVWAGENTCSSDNSTLVAMCYVILSLKAQGKL